MLETAETFLKRGSSEKFKSIREDLSHLAKAEISFYFLTGNLIKAIRHGDWVLIDEINLAPNEVLQKLLPAIDGSREVLFYERGDDRFVPVHPEFRVVCCMNPGGDIGKKELPANLRGKFT